MQTQCKILQMVKLMIQTKIFKENENSNIDIYEEDQNRSPSLSDSVTEMAASDFRAKSDPNHVVYGTHVDLNRQLRDKRI